nr:dickkopf-related protein 1 [Nothobranchius furzeri]
MMQMLLAHRFLAVYLTLFGCFGDVYAGAVLMNSNSIKNLPGAPAGKGVEAVSPSPRTPPSGGTGLKLPVDTLQQPGVCTDSEDCGGDEFCNEARGVCLPCRKNRKRCLRDSVCCAGSRCSNGVCQTSDMHDSDASIPALHKHNTTMEHLGKRPPAAHGFQPSAVKGQEGDTCLRSTDCSEGLCCARHFWSRICKPVLTEGQVCTRHRRKGNHGLELFQRCDCGEALVCRPEKGERDPSVSRTAGRNLHTCQRR